jgi:hypothetical protein
MLNYIGQIRTCHPIYFSYQFNDLLHRLSSNTLIISSMSCVFLLTIVVRQRYMSSVTYCRFDCVQNTINLTRSIHFWMKHGGKDKPLSVDIQHEILVVVDEFTWSTVCLSYSRIIILFLVFMSTNVWKHVNRKRHDQTMCRFSSNEQFMCHRF